MLHLFITEFISVHPSSKPETPVTEADPKFFSHVEGDVERILRKEKMQEEYQKVKIKCALLSLLLHYILSGSGIYKSFISPWRILSFCH